MLHDVIKRIIRFAIAAVDILGDLLLLDYLTTFRLLPDQQSAYRAHHSTETAVLKVLSDILLAVDSGDLADDVRHLAPMVILF